MAPLIFLTGGTGLVGRTWRALLEQQRGSGSVAVLSRTGGSADVLQGDLTKPHLGLPVHLYRQLTQRLTAIYHCAADIRFGATIEQARATNVEGTRRLLALARDCRRLEKFVQVSSTYVAGRQEGLIAEVPLTGQAGFCNAYQQSKWEAEQLVLAGREVPAMVVRLSSLIGEAATGRVTQFNYFHQLMKLVPRNLLPVVPGDPDVRVDLIPVDWAVPALHDLAERRFAGGVIYHVCAGADRSLTAGELMERAFAAIGRGGRMPRLVPLADFHQFATGWRPGAAQEFLRVTGTFLPHLLLDQTFARENATAALADSGLQFPETRHYFDSIVRFCAASDWGRRTCA